MKGVIMMTKKKEIQLLEGVDNDFMDILNEVIKEHDVAFKGLSPDFFNINERNTNNHKETIQKLGNR